MSQQSPPRTAPPSLSPAELFNGPPAAGQRMDVRGMLPSLLVNAVAPFAAYQALTGNGVESAQALTISAVFPVIGIVFGFARTRRPDMIGLVSR